MDTEVLENSEIYAWLGKMLNTHFFIHTVSSEQWDENISLGLYNCLMHNKFITSSDENIVIYTVNKNNGQVKCIAVSHQLFEDKFKVDANNLGEIFPHILKQERNDLVAIQYFYDNPRYSLFELDNCKKMWENILKDCPANKINVCEIVYGMTNKPFV